MKGALIITGHGMDDVIAWRPEGSVEVRTFLGQAQTLASQLPDGAWLVNQCEDRYHFAVGFVAGLLRQKVSLQPSSQSAETLKFIALHYPGAFLLNDGFVEAACSPRFEAPVLSEIPRVPENQVAAILFTSGSTGTPRAHPRNFGQLALSARSEAQGLGLLGRQQSIVGTVPPQHSYGFESTFLLALYGGCRFWSGQPFYPQDIVAALARVPAPRMLVTTPFHLAALMGSGLELPPLSLVLSATAPLSEALARQVEARAQAPVFEIYGSTETSALAARRTTEGPVWTLLPGVALVQEEHETMACEGHVPSRVAIADLVELTGERQFVLNGRQADQVNIAGKRTSLAYLNHQVSQIEGVQDAVFFMPETGAKHVSRLTAFVVAPGMDKNTLMAAMRWRLDPVFLPRPLIYLDALPRNQLGKLPLSELQRLFREKQGHG